MHVRLSQRLRRALAPLHHERRLLLHRAVPRHLHPRLCALHRLEGPGDVQSERHQYHPGLADAHERLCVRVVRKCLREQRRDDERCAFGFGSEARNDTCLRCLVLYFARLVPPNVRAGPRIGFPVFQQWDAHLWFYWRCLFFCVCSDCYE